MSTFDLLKFYHTPEQFLTNSTDAELWLQGLQDTHAATANDDVKLRPAQEDAWTGMAPDQVGLLLGPPGTGKTFTIAAMICGAISARKKQGLPCRVYISGFTRNSIANVLEYLQSFAQKYPELQDLQLGYDQDNNVLNAKGIPQVRGSNLNEYLDVEHSVLGGTVWSMFKFLDKNHHLSKEARKGLQPSRQAAVFDLLVIDEASQLPLTHSLMAMAGLKADGRIIVCGDNNQLPPIFSTDLDIEDSVAEVSIYDFLVQHNFPEFGLNETFRLNRPLVQFPSQAYYNGNYVSAPPVAERRIEYIENWTMGLPKWIEAILDPNIPMVVMIHDGPDAGKINKLEGELVQVLTAHLHQVLPPDPDHFWHEQLAVISPHNKNNEYLRNILKSVQPDPYVDTVDRFQGRERDCIVYSMCVSDPEFAKNEGGFLFSPERLNVAITRARSKLILVLNRNLLNVKLTEDEQIEALASFRSLVFSGESIGQVSLEHKSGTREHESQTLNVDIYGLPFESTDIERAAKLIQEERNNPEPTVLKATPNIPVLSNHLEQIIAAIQSYYESNTIAFYKTVKLSALTDFLLDNNIQHCFDDFLQLFKRGRIYLLEENGHLVLGNHKSTVLPVRVPNIVPNTSDQSDIEYRILEFLYTQKHKVQYGSRWNGLQQYFLWVNEHKQDLLWPILENMAAHNRIEIHYSKKAPKNKSKAWIHLKDFALFNQPPKPPEPPLTTDDYKVLNAIEDREVSWINFGVVEHWLTNDDWSTLGMAPKLVKESIPRLIAHGHLMQIGQWEPQYRSRMAEMARLIRYVKQRFAFSSVDDSPFLVRALKLIVKTRRKPQRNQLLFDVLDNLASEPCFEQDTTARKVCEAFKAMFGLLWGETASISQFQRDSWGHIFRKWTGNEDGSGVVITADTGAGKTEATCIPILMGAIYDKIKSQNTPLGCQAILIYPRIRLANNQAQRLTHYVKCLHDLGMPLLTVGLQTGTVPKDWKKIYENKDLWKPKGHNLYTFPFFKCPSCQSELHCEANGGSGLLVDKLLCEDSTCGWSFDGWVGTKSALAQNPPSLFLPTADSLHQWMHKEAYFDNIYGTIFGDTHLPPPKAILADEIHLYSMIFGSQFAYTLRRALFRLQVNDPDGRIPLAIGMSATLSSPRKLWADLTGKARKDIVHVEPHGSEMLDNPNGREYYYFVQPEVESRGRDIAAASTTIQTAMCLAHNMRRRTADQGGYRSVVFMDSLDKIKRMNADFIDAEENKKLAQLRIKPDGKHCCGTPDQCQRFEQGECWYFASNDSAQWTAHGRYLTQNTNTLSHLRVSPPISSQLSGNAESLIYDNDILFATSSLEVGFDDPDMMMVYQHYAPTNLASFIQRKGRGGRGSDDRPITGVTLSLFSPTDSWYFRYPERMLDAKSFHIPINVQNFFVRRGQVLSLAFDVLQKNRNKAVQQQNKKGLYLSKTNCFSYGRDILVDQAIRTVFGPNIFKELHATGIQDFWVNQILKNNPGLLEFYGTKDAKDPKKTKKFWPQLLSETCNFLADPISLPALVLSIPNDDTFNHDPKEPFRSQKEDISFAFSELSPGRISYRWGRSRHAHWNPYQGPQAPMFQKGTTYKMQTIGSNVDLPLALKELWTQHDLPTEFRRPTQIQIVTAGKNENGQWKSAWQYNSGNDSVQQKHQMSNTGVGDKSSSTLLGALLIKQDDQHAHTVPISSCKKYCKTHPKVFKTHSTTLDKTGLIASRVYWGTDANLVEIRQNGPKLEKETHSKRTLFIEPGNSNKPGLYGYQIETEGVSLDLDAEQIKSFIEEFITGLDLKGKRHYVFMYFKYRLLQRSYELKLNSYELNMLADLIGTGMKLPTLRPSITNEINKSHFNPNQWTTLLLSIYTEGLELSASITEQRIERLVESITLHSAQTILPVLRSTFKEIASPDNLKAYLTSTLLHSFTTRFKQLVVKHGQGDERRLLGHVRLPTEYETTNHRVTILELGSFGDGTTRTFEVHMPSAFEDWTENGFVECQNARTDQALLTLLNNPSLVENWRNKTQDERVSPQFQLQLAQTLKLRSEIHGDIIQLCTRLLFQSIVIDDTEVDYFDLFTEIQALKEELEATRERIPTNDELLTYTVQRVRQGTQQTAKLNTLLDAYRQLHDENNLNDADSLSPERRLTNQIYQISGTLCHDGCQACLHVQSDVLHYSTSSFVHSRQLLEAYWRYTHPTDTPKEEPSALKQPNQTYSEQEIEVLFPKEYRSLLSNLNAGGYQFSYPTEVLGDATIDDQTYQNVVIGKYLTALTHNNQTIYLVDENQTHLEDLKDKLSQTGSVVLITPTDDLTYILQSIGE